jgi:hypothetical protein
MLPIYLGLFLIAASILSLEIALTRAFAILMVSLPRVEALVQTRRSFGTLLGGSASERSAFANAYEYDVSPSSDDAPFILQPLPLLGPASQQTQRGEGPHRLRLLPSRPSRRARCILTRASSQ